MNNFAIKNFNRLSAEENSLALSDNIMGLFDEKIMMEANDDEITALLEYYEIPSAM